MIETSHNAIEARSHSTASGQDRTGRMTVTYVQPTHSKSSPNPQPWIDVPAAATNCGLCLDFHLKSPSSGSPQ
jgi:hypothetical protein